MTRYEDPGASDGHGGPHPLSGIPQTVLDAATDMLGQHDLIRTSLDSEEQEALAHAVVLVVVERLRSARMLAAACDHDHRCCTIHGTHVSPHIGCILR